MDSQVDINDYTFTDEEQPAEGDHVRVRPMPDFPKTYGQGEPPAGPSLNNVQFAWGAALEVSAAPENGIGDAGEGLVHPDAIASTPSLFMSEENYQEYLSQL